MSLFIFLKNSVCNISFKTVNEAINPNVTISYMGFSHYPSYTLHYPCTDTSSCTPYIFYLPKGTYLFEAWGASGGDFDISIKGGKGGYTIAINTFEVSTRIYGTVGGKGTNVLSATNAPGGYNGGGIGGKGSTTARSGGGGGGASDIRLSFNSYNSRLLVAGGGGGAGAAMGGGVGGGGNGGKAPDYSSAVAGGGGTQTSGGTSSAFGNAQTGSFGIGGNGGSLINGLYGCGGGGGGYYGGGGGSGSSSNSEGRIGGGGGSGYIRIQNEILYGILPGTFDGNSQFPDPFGNYEIGHSGNGCIRITCIVDPSQSLEALRTANYNFASSFSMTNILWTLISFLVVINQNF